MEELKLLLEAAKSGYALPIIAWFLLDKGKVWQRKRTGKYVSYETLAEDIDRMEKSVEQLNVKLNGHLEKAASEDIKVSVMENDIKHQGGEITETKEDVKNIYRILGEIKNLIIERRA